MGIITPWINLEWVQKCLFQNINRDGAYLLPDFPPTFNNHGWSSGLYFFDIIPYFFFRASSRKSLPNSLPAPNLGISSSGLKSFKLFSRSILTCFIISFIFKQNRDYVLNCTVCTLMLTHLIPSFDIDFERSIKPHDMVPLLVWSIKILDSISCQQLDS